MDHDFVRGKGDMVFFFKQKTAYEFLSGLVGSEMCIRASPYWPLYAQAQLAGESENWPKQYRPASLDFAYTGPMGPDVTG